MIKLLLQLLIVLLMALPILSQNKVVNFSYADITKVPRFEIDNWIKNEIALSKGDMNTGRYHIVLAFSTGHYGSDPLHAIAMRRIAFQILNNFCCPGDQVTAFGWEMNIWKNGETIQLKDSEIERKKFINSVPYTPMADSVGGHDTERAVVDIIRTLKERKIPSSSTVVLLIANGASQLPVIVKPGISLLGENNIDLQNELNTEGYRPLIRQNFIAETRKGPREITITALFPKQLITLIQNAGKRYPTFSRTTWQPYEDMPDKLEKLPNPEKKIVNWVLITILIFLLLLLTWVIYYYIKQSKPNPSGDSTTSKCKKISGVLELSLNRKAYRFDNLNENSIFKLISTGEGFSLICNSMVTNENIEENDKKVHLIFSFIEGSGKNYNLVINRQESLQEINFSTKLDRVNLSPDKWQLPPDTKIILKMKLNDTAEEARLILSYNTMPNN